MSAVRFIERASDAKLAPRRMIPSGSGHRDAPRAAGPYCSSTYVSIEATCPDACRFKEAGCYVRAGFTASLSKKLDRAAARLSGDAVAVLEAEHIKAAFNRGPIPQDGARGGRDLRLHVGGDVPSAFGARVLAVAARDWIRRGGGTVWIYTKRWKEIARSAFGPISALASVESLSDARRALRRGYAAALVVDHHHRDTAELVDGMRIIPCPAQTRRRTCIECRLCLDPDLARRKVVIAFALHGQQADRVRLPVIREVAA